MTDLTLSAVLNLPMDDICFHAGATAQWMLHASIGTLALAYGKRKLRSLSARRTRRKAARRFNAYQPAGCWQATKLKVQWKQ